MKCYRADLHIHSVLSPCGSLKMSPKNIFENAKKNKINLLAITDHNSMKNCLSYKKVALKYKINFLFGVEIQTAEEIHLIALFDDNDNAMSFDNLLYESLLPVKNNPEFFGDQVIIDENENILGFEEKALINSSVWDLETTINNVLNYNGFCFPAHIDAPTFSIISQLGFIPDNLKIEALGITKKCNLKKLIDKFPYLKKYAFIKNSDAHYPNDVGSGYTEFYLNSPSIAELRMAVKNKNNRKIYNNIGG